MPFGSTERDLRQQGLVQQLTNRQQFSEYLGGTNLREQALDPQFFQGRAEGVFTSQGRNITAETRLRLDQAMTGLQGLGGGIASKGRAAIGAGQVSQIGGLRRTVNTQAANQQTRAEGQFFSALSQLAQMDTAILDAEREYAQRAFPEGVDPRISAGLEDDDLEALLDWYQSIGAETPDYHIAEQAAADVGGNESIAGVGLYGIGDEYTEEEVLEALS